jgi:hypothetical protein
LSTSVSTPQFNRMGFGADADVNRQISKRKSPSV